MTDTAQGVEKAAEALAAGSGPFAVDAERASGIRYGQRTFLAQIKRPGAGTFLIDTETLRRDRADLSPLAKVLAEDEWILHSAMQDLPGLRDLGLIPPRVFDTEIAAKMAGFERFGLAAVVERTLGIRLAKDHQNSDWSKRPLPTSWLNYAALDVEMLHEVREALIADLAMQGKLEWAYEELDHLSAQPMPAPKPDPWRRTSGASALKNRRQLSQLKSLWEAREHLAERKDLPPTHLLPDSALIAAASAGATTAGALLKVHGFHGRWAAKEAPRWAQAVKDGAEAAQYPSLKPKAGAGSIPSSPRSWQRTKPEAAELLAQCRELLATRAQELSLGPEMLLAPASLRALCWSAPEPWSQESIAERLQELGARPWQIRLTAPLLAAAGSGEEQAGR